MSIIVYRDGVMASDSALSNDDSSIYANVKLLRLPDGTLLGGTGDQVLVQKWFRWVRCAEGPIPPEPLPTKDKEFSILMVRPGEPPRSLFPDGWLEYSGAEYMAVGSGAYFAYGALHAGANAAAAVRAAIHFSCTCGGQVQVITHEG